MKGERQLLRIGEYLIARACRRLPPDIREERYREWAAELPAILNDPQIRFAPRRAVRMLAYAADTLRGTAMTPLRARRPAPQGVRTFFIPLAYGLIQTVTYTSDAVRAPGHTLNYLWLAWALLVVACAVSVLARCAAHVSWLIVIMVLLMGVVINFWNAAQAPGDWVNYFWAAFLLLIVPPSWLGMRWASIRRR